MRNRAKSPGGAREESGPNSAATLTRGLEILRAFGPADNTLGNLDLIDRTGLPKATVSRLTYVLVNLGYLLYDEKLGRYSIGPATISLGYSSLRSMPVVRVVQPILRDLADETGLASAIGTRDNLEMIYLANCRPIGPVALQLNVGSRLPIWRTAMGLAYLAAMNPEKRDEVVERIVLGDPTRESQIRESAESAVASYQARGFVTTYGSWYSYINGVGTAFRPEDGSPLIALTCGGIADMLSREKCETVVAPKILHAVKRLRSLLELGIDPGK